MTVSINRKIRDLFDSVEGISFLDSDLKPECKSKSIDTTYTSALPCRHCKAAVIAEITTTVYDLDPYVENQKVKHVHPPDLETVNEILECVATEKRLLEDLDPNDYIYRDRRGDRN